MVFVALVVSKEEEEEEEAEAEEEGVAVVVDVGSGVVLVFVTGVSGTSVAAGSVWGEDAIGVVDAVVGPGATEAQALLANMARELD